MLCAISITVCVRSLSVYTDTFAKHPCLYTLLQNGHSYCKSYLQLTKCLYAVPATESSACARVCLNFLFLCYI